MFSTDSSSDDFTISASGPAEVPPKKLVHSTPIDEEDVLLQKNTPGGKKN